MFDESLHRRHDSAVRQMLDPHKDRSVAHFRAERKLLRTGCWPIAGVDEVGRGPLAGPVAAAAVILDPKNLPKGVDDSKALDAETRAAMHDDIMARALAVGIAFASVEEIDSINIRQATFRAMCRAVHALAIKPVFVLVDGNDMPPGLACPGETLIKGDASSLSIAAASIVAKVTRDRLMKRLSDHFPDYGFAQHVGYATPHHRAALKQHGPSPFHRTSFAPCRPEPASVV